MIARHFNVARKEFMTKVAKKLYRKSGITRNRSTIMNMKMFRRNTQRYFSFHQPIVLSLPFLVSTISIWKCSFLFCWCGFLHPHSETPRVSLLGSQEGLFLIFFFSAVGENRSPPIPDIHLADQKPPINGYGHFLATARVLLPGVLSEGGWSGTHNIYLHMGILVIICIHHYYKKVWGARL